MLKSLTKIYKPLRYYKQRYINTSINKHNIDKIYNQHFETVMDKGYYSNTFGIIETRTHWGQGKEGVDNGPLYITENSAFNNYINQLKLVGYNWKYHTIIEQIGDNTIPSHSYIDMDSTYSQLEHVTKTVNLDRNPIEGVSFSHYLENINHTLYDCNQVSQINNHYTINLLGDHSSGIGTVLSSLSYDPDTIVIWIDAHPDINVPETSPTGNCHGMPLAFATGLMNSYIKDDHCWDWVYNIPKLKFENLIYIGIRDIDKGEQKFIDEHNIKVINLDQIDLLQKYISGKNVHVSFDVDSIDPFYFPCTGTPVTNGLTPYDVELLIRKISEHSNLFKLDITEFNPEINPKMAGQCCQLIVDRVLKPCFDIYY